MAAAAGMVIAHHPGTSGQIGLADYAPAYVPSSKNGGRKVRGNRHVQRAAAKKRNVRRFRGHSRGRR